MDWQYLLYIAVLSSGYVGFTAFFIALRQMVGIAADRVATWSMRYLINVALCTTATSLLPPLLSLATTAVNALHVASGITCVLMTRLDVVFLYRLPRIYEEPRGAWFWFLFSCAIVADVVFAACALDFFPGRELVAFCFAQTIELTVMFCYFSNALKQLLPFEWEVGADR